MKAWIKQNKFISGLFLFFTGFLVCQRLSGLSWDWVVYVLNSQYWFGSGVYFEPFRPPLLPLLMGLFSPLGWKLAELGTVVFISGLFLYSVIQLAKTFKLDKKILYALMLNPFLVLYATREGTELLSLALLQLFIAFYFRKDKKPFALIALSLAALTRYTNFIFFPLVLLEKNKKKIFQNLILLAIPFIPWFIYNQLKFGHPLASIIDLFMFNMVYRAYIDMAPSLSQILLAFNYLALLAVIYYKKNKPVKQDLIWLYVLVASLYVYVTTPVKDPRHLFLAILPLSVLSAKLLSKRKKIHKYIAGLNAALLISLALVFPFAVWLESPVDYAVSVPDAGSCMTSSNAWVYLNYFGTPTDYFPQQPELAEKIDQGYRIVLFKFICDPPYACNASFLAEQPTIRDAYSYVILGEESACADIHKV
ncbi:MAG: hypothetical protein GOU99_01695, partial [Candidatus Altiarchaeota archaeon]|nr:hypothetical protein [Candidatus Altiarchaeota archaeon]